jgi:unsaturated rhamnogalacturonyl hydrolase
MTGLDLSSTTGLPAPLDPLPAPAVTADLLESYGDRITERTWESGLPSWFWGEGVCLLGMIRLSSAIGRQFPERVRRWLDDKIAAGITVEHVNNIAPGTAAVLAADGDDGLFLDVADRLCQWLERNATRDRSGAIEHWPGGVWADTAFMAGVFLGHLGAARRRPDLVEEFARQLVAHAHVLQDPDSGLIAHGSHAGVTIPSYWGRANAWWALASVELLELVESLPSSTVPTAPVDEVRDRLRRQLRTLATLQPDHGIWSVLVDDQPENAGILETSAAAGIGAAILRAAALPEGVDDDVAKAGWRAVRGVLAYVDDDGTLTKVSAGTVLQLVPYGYSVIRDDRIQLWGQGLALHAIAAAVGALRRGEAPA